MMLMRKMDSTEDGDEMGGGGGRGGGGDCEDGENGGGGGIEGTVFHDAGLLLEHCHHSPDSSRSMNLRAGPGGKQSAAAAAGSSNGGGHSHSTNRTRSEILDGLFVDDIGLLDKLKLVAAPSQFGAVAITRLINLKYREYLKLIKSAADFSDNIEAILLNLDSSCPSFVGGANPGSGIYGGGQLIHPPRSQFINIGLTCMSSVLMELSEREPSVCANALNSLQAILQSLNPNQLATESTSFLNKLINGLAQLSAVSSYDEISGKASSALISLAVAAGKPEVFLKVIYQFLKLDALLSSGGMALMEPGGSRDSNQYLTIPRNFRLLYLQSMVGLCNSEVNRGTGGGGLSSHRPSPASPSAAASAAPNMNFFSGGGGAGVTENNFSNGQGQQQGQPAAAFGGASNSSIDGSGRLPSWYTVPIAESKELVSFPIPVPANLSPDVLASKQLSGALVSDGAYVYVLTWNGLYKLGTGFSETVAGREYASNTLLKSTGDSWSSCVLSICNGSLYLRRKHSSRLWVLDTDSLREIGEILLPATAVRSAISCHNNHFSLLSVDASGRLTSHALTDGFKPNEKPEFTVKLSQSKLFWLGGRKSGGGPPESTASTSNSSSSVTTIVSNHLIEHMLDFQMGKRIGYLLTSKGSVYACQLRKPASGGGGGNPAVIGGTGTSAAPRASAGVSNKHHDNATNAAAASNKQANGNEAKQQQQQQHQQHQQGIIGPGTSASPAAASSSSSPSAAGSSPAASTATSWSLITVSELMAQISVSVDGNNVLFRSQNGNVWYSGNGLDCDTQGPVQTSLKERASYTHPRKLSIPGQRRICHIAAAASVLGFVSESGKVFLYGRHVTHTHPDTGLVLGLEAIHVMTLEFGKTHAVALSRQGYVYTWGLNNLHQCGRAEQLSSTPTRTGSTTTNCSSDTPSSTENTGVDAVVPSELSSSPAGVTGGGSSTGGSSGGVGLLRGGIGGGLGGIIRGPSLKLCAPTDHLWIKDMATICTACSFCSAHGPKCPSREKSPIKGTISSCGQGEAGCLRCGVCRGCGERDWSGGGGSSDKDSTDTGGSDRSRRLLLSPAKLPIRGDERIVKISVGNYHTLLLSAEGVAYSFGSNCQGQLGVGDTRRRIGPMPIHLKDNVKVVQIAAGANHSVLRGQNGHVYTFGSNRQEQLGREGQRSKLWHTTPGQVVEMKGKQGFWIGASGESTFIAWEERLIPSLDATSIIANHRSLIILQPSDNQLNYIVLRRKQLKFRYFTLGTLPEVNNLKGVTWSLDPLYDVIWTYNANTGMASAFTYWDIQSGGKPLSWRKYGTLPSPGNILATPQFWLPSSPGTDAVVKRNQAGLSIMGCLYSLTYLALYQLKGQNPSTKYSSSNESCPNALCSEDKTYRSVSRFQNYGGGWGYSAQSIEAIQFQPSHDIQVVGYGLYGGRGEYLARIKLLRLVGEDHDEHNLELIAESDEILYESPLREKAKIFFPRPAFCQASHTYIAWAQINGPSSDCGAGGQRVVNGEDGVSFHFQNSRLSNNGTDVHVGQIPCILYQFPSGSSFLTSPSPEEEEDDLSPMEIASIFHLHSWNGGGVVGGGGGGGGGIGGPGSYPTSVSPLLSVSLATFNGIHQILEWCLGKLNTTDNNRDCNNRSCSNGGSGGGQQMMPPAQNASSSVSCNNASNANNPIHLDNGGSGGIRSGNGGGGGMPPANNGGVTSPDNQRSRNSAFGSNQYLHVGGGGAEGGGGGAGGGGQGNNSNSTSARKQHAAAGSYGVSPPSGGYPGYYYSYDQQQSNDAIDSSIYSYVTLSFRLLRFYIPIYFNNSNNTQADKNLISERCLKLLNQYLSLELPKLSTSNGGGGIGLMSDESDGDGLSGGGVVSDLEGILNEAVAVHVDCFQELYTTHELIQGQLGDLMRRKDECHYLLIALLESLSKCDHVLPILLFSDSWNQGGGGQQEGAGGGSGGIGGAAGNGVGGNNRNGVGGGNNHQQPPSKNFPSLLSFLVELSFSPIEHNRQRRLQKAAAQLLLKIAQDLVGSSENQPVIPIMATPRRFRRISSQTLWDSTNGTPDAIAFKTETYNLSLHGINVFVGSGSTYSYTLDVLVNQGENSFQEAWQVLEKVTGSITLLDSGAHETAQIRLHKPMKLIPNCLYAVRICLQGGKTWGGEGGQGTVRTLNGSNIHFQPCSLSLNGTNVSRGQIPSLLYSFSESRNLSRTLRFLAANRDQTSKWFLLMVRTVSSKIIKSISSGYMTSDCWLISEFFGWISLFLTVNPRRSLDILGAADDLLPVIVSANNRSRERKTSNSLLCAQPQQLVVESEHPYKPAQITSYVTRFDSDVKCLCLEFDDKCSTCQPEDLLTIFWSRDGVKYNSIGKFGGSWGWPNRAILLPGNTLWFVLETAWTNNRSNVERMYGFRCIVSSCSPSSTHIIPLLEQELTWLVSSACRFLIGEPDADVHLSLLEEEVGEMISKHGGLLRKGLSLSHHPTVQELLQGSFPNRNICPEIKFLNEFISASEKTAAGRLGRWLTCEPFVDLDNSELNLESNGMDLRSGSRTTVCLVLRDQYGRYASSSGIKVEVTVRYGHPSDSSPLSGISMLPSLAALQANTYQPTYLNKARYIAINMMPAFSEYSSEELRLAYFRDAVLKETIVLRPKQDGNSYVGEWIPRQSGTYLIEGRLDGFKLSQSYRIQVGHDSPSNPVNSDIPGRRQVAQLSRAHLATVPLSSSTRGVRIRTAPTLKAQQIGIIPREATITYIEEIENNEGLWLRLTDEAALLYCDSTLFPNQSWCLQYNSLTQRQLLWKDDEMENTDGEEYASSVNHALVIAAEERYTVVSESSLVIYPSPSTDETSIGTIPTGQLLTSSGWLQNRQGVWIRLQAALMKKFCWEQNKYSDGYCMARSSAGSILLNRATHPTSPPQKVSSASAGVAAGRGSIGGSETAATSAAQNGFVSNGNNGNGGEGGMVVNTEMVGNQGVGPVLMNNIRKVSEEQRKPVAHVWPTPSSGSNKSACQRPISAISPSVSDCSRSVFAAFIWHEGLVHDAMACAAYLKFHPELGCIQARQNDLANYNVPSSLQLFAKLWQEVNNAILTSIQQHLIMPSPPMAIRENTGAGAGEPGIGQTGAAAGGSGGGGGTDGGRNDGEQLCELCREWFPSPLAAHMRISHPGCGSHAGGQGYNSLGKYTSGWTGSCGDGGRGVATWYLLCNACRYRHYNQKPGGNQNLRNPLDKRNQRARMLRMSMGAVEPQTVIKQNAMFLLELNSGTEESRLSTRDGSTGESGWAINLFPDNISNANSPSNLSAASTALLFGSKTPSHASDPGPKRQLSALNQSVPCSEPVSDCFTNGAGGGGVVNNQCGGSREMKESRILLASPSAALKTLQENNGNGDGKVGGSAHGGAAGGSGGSSVSNSLRRPVLAFVIQNHDLNRLKETMKTAIRRSTVLGHSFKVWNWLLRLVTTESGVMDILWNFLVAMSSFGGGGGNGGGNGGINDDGSQAGRVDGGGGQRRAALNQFKSGDLMGVKTLYKHPWHVCLLAGGWSYRMLRQFHLLLQTTTVILRSESIEPAMRRLCFRSWMFQMSPHEQDLILGSQLLSCVGRVMSDSGSMSQQGHAGGGGGSSTLHYDGSVEKLENLNSYLIVETSSRPSMAPSLTDGTTETFWESGDEDKNRHKVIYITMAGEASATPVMLSVYIDNPRDEGHRVSHVAVFPSHCQSKLKSNLFYRTLDFQFCGWITMSIVGHSKVNLEMKGPDNSLRVRLISVDGRLKESLASMNNLMKPSPSHLLNFSAAQADAFSVFQTIAGQAFTTEFSEDEAPGISLRQQVFDILFSRAQLHSLQGYVCSQIVSALEREVEILGNSHSKRNYSYCCGLMAMLSRISSTQSAREIFSARGNLLAVLAELLLFASPLVQCQTIDTIEKLLALFNPKACDSKSLTLNLLAVLAKVITIQVREKSSRSVSTATISTSLDETGPSCWRLDRACTAEIGKLVCNLVVDIAYQRFGNDWATAVKAHVADQILLLASIPESHCGQDKCIRSRKFWLALGALSVLRDQTWLEGTPGWNSNNEERDVILCENHDDGRTEAQLHCLSCESNLCRACFSVLHLSRKNRNHPTQVVGSSENRPGVNVHEGCSRLRLPWLLVLLDGTTLNGMVEFNSQNQAVNDPNSSAIRSSSSQSSKLLLGGKPCRFCQNPTGSELGTVCGHSECQSLQTTACKQILPCGHLCGGVLDEVDCLPCMKCQDDPRLRQDEDDLCVICFTDRIGAAPAIQLSCTHVFHLHCAKATLSRKWPGPRILFNFMRCPLCQKTMNHPALDGLLTPLRALYNEVVGKAKLRLEYDQLLDCPAIKNPGGPFYNDPVSFALEHYVYILCHKCQKAYFGGESHCQEALVSSEYNPEELLCGGCSDISGAQICPRHGSEFLEYKCRFCCSVAVFFCFGTTHFCAPCHDDFQRLITIPTNKLPVCPVGPRAVSLDSGNAAAATGGGQGGTTPCPLKVKHPPTGEEFALGCGICRNLSSF